MVALVLVVLQAGADISPTNIAFWIPPLIMGSRILESRPESDVQRGRGV